LIANQAPMSFYEHLVSLLEKHNAGSDVAFCGEICCMLADSGNIPAAKVCRKFSKFTTVRLTHLFFS